MKLLFKQRFFSWLDSYDIYYEDGSVAYEVGSKLSFSHHMYITDRFGREAGSIRQRVFSWTPTFELYEGEQQIGTLERKLFSFFYPKYDIEALGWHAEGNFMEWDYDITDRNGYVIAHVSKELFNFTDTYVIDVMNPNDALYALMFVLAIDAEKC